MWANVRNGSLTDIGDSATNRPAADPVEHRDQKSCRRTYPEVSYPKGGGDPIDGEREALMHASAARTRVDLFPNRQLPLGRPEAGELGG